MSPDEKLLLAKNNTIQADNYEQPNLLNNTTSKFNPQNRQISMEHNSHEQLGITYLSGGNNRPSRPREPVFDFVMSPLPLNRKQFLDRSR